MQATRDNKTSRPVLLNRKIGLCILHGLNACAPSNFLNQSLLEGWSSSYINRFSIIKNARSLLVCIQTVPLIGLFLLCFYFLYTFLPPPLYTYNVFHLSESLRFRSELLFQFYVDIFLFWSEYFDRSFLTKKEILLIMMWTEKFIRHFDVYVTDREW